MMGMAHRIKRVQFIDWGFCDGVGPFLRIRQPGPLGAGQVTEITGDALDLMIESAASLRAEIDAESDIGGG